MRPNCTALCFLPLLLFSAPASAKTCTASGHSDCTITCDDGCAVLYEEPNGPCHKICSDDDSGNEGSDHKAGELEFNPQTVQLAPLIKEVIGTAGQLAEQNKNRLVVDAQENLGVLTVEEVRRHRPRLGDHPAFLPAAQGRHHGEE